jgi:hypothetical protein
MALVISLSKTFAFFIMILKCCWYFYFDFDFLLLLGKTTILKILGGKHMVEPEMVRVLGRSAFHDTTLTSSGDLCYLGGEVGAWFHYPNQCTYALFNPCDEI